MPKSCNQETEILSGGRKSFKCGGEICPAAAETTELSGDRQLPDACLADLLPIPGVKSGPGIISRRGERNRPTEIREFFKQLVLMIIECVLHIAISVCFYIFRRLTPLSYKRRTQER
jgi:hypothetical protein